ncbi:Reverse transcriptase (RNA-dependent DNA polymerase), partial [Pristimantis euphronides]
MQPLFDCLKTEPFVLTDEAVTCFERLKQLIISAPALGLPNYDIPFHLFLVEIKGHATGVLTQQHGSRKRPVAYYSARLNPVAQGAPSCVRAVPAVSLLVDKSAEIVLDNPLSVYTPHDIAAILNQVQPRHISMARQLRLQCALLMPPNITFHRCTSQNPSTLIPIECLYFERREDKGTEGTGGGGEKVERPGELEHDCFHLMEQETMGLPNICSTPITNPDFELFVDGSRSMGEDGKFHTGYAVVTQHAVLRAEPLPPHMSAQEAELKALIEAVKMGTGRKGNIYTDSAYAYGVAHDYGVIWKARNFLTAAGTPIKNAKLISELLDVLGDSLQIAVIKIAAHTKAHTPEAKGNHLADAAAKEAARKPWVRNSELIGSVKGSEVPDLTPEVLQTFQKQASKGERDHWERQGASLQVNLWGKGKRLCLPRALYPMMMTLSHLPTHLSKNAMTQVVDKHWIAPGFSVAAARYCAGCDICLKNNPGQTVKAPKKQTP